MKIIFNIIASSDYNNFKEIWIDNIMYFQQNFPEYANIIEFYFTYNEINKINNETFRLEANVKQNNKNFVNYFDFYYINNSKYERKRCIFKRNLAFLKFLKLENKSVDFVIRTNLSTMFNFPLFINWIKNLPKKKLLAATIASGIDINEFSIFSGTNFLISYDIAETLLLSEENIETYFNKLQIEYPEDDLLMGQILIQNISDLNIITINRCDYVECKYIIQSIENYIPPSIIFEKCHYTDEIFCFRFKTLNRDFDSKNMKCILQNHIKNKISLENCIEYFKNKNNSLQLILNQPNLYKEFGQKSFKTYEKIILHQKENIPFFSNTKLKSTIFN